MQVKVVRREFVRPPNPQAEHLRCIAHLDADVTEILPFLNTLVGAHTYFTDPPALTIKLPGKLATVHPREIAINIVKDEGEAEEILRWLVGKVNEAIERRDEIEPGYTVAEKPRVLDIFRALPGTNCRDCGRPTCLAFAAAVREGEASFGECPCLDEAGAGRLAELLGDPGRS